MVGGSIAGCAAALAASRGGAERITVLERADDRLRDRGVGIALQSDRYDELREAGYVAPEMPWAPLTRRLWSVRDGEAEHGRVVGEQPFPFRAYSWGSLWSELRRRVPGDVVHRSGAVVTGVEPDADGVTLRLADGHEERFDIVIGADGYRSVVREAMFPGADAAYAGYIGWRGTSSDVADLPSDGEDAHNIVFPGGHCMIYRIPDGRGGHSVTTDGCWKLRAMPRRLRAAVPLRVMSAPSRAMAPRSGRSVPAIRLSRVVLPAPLGPMTACRAPGTRRRLTPSTAVSVP
ncbi:hypothetical protein SCALM49S_06825 [Streptomyces californicus]